MAVNKVVRGSETLIDLTGDTVTSASHIMAGYIGHLANGSQVTGTGQSGPSATRHTLLFEYTDETSVTVYAYYDDALIGSAITATTPTEHGGKEVQSASLDGVEWYAKPTYVFETVFDDIIGWYPETTGPKAYCWITTLGNVEMPLGSIWRITIAGNEYILTAKLHTENGGVYIGNVRYVYGFDYEADEPILFGMERYSDQAWVGTTDLMEPNTAGRFKVERAITT